MATTQEILIPNKFSQELTEAIDNCVNAFEKTSQAVARCVEIAKRENADLKLVGKIIRQRLLQAGFHRNSATNFLPEECKSKPRGSTAAGISTNFVQTSDTDTDTNTQLEPSEYRSDQLAKYSKQFLIEIIHYLEQKQTVKQVIQEVKTITKPSPKPLETKSSPKTIGSTQPNVRTSKDKEIQVLELHAKGNSVRQIAKETGVSNSSIIRILRRN